MNSLYSVVCTGHDVVPRTRVVPVANPAVVPRTRVVPVANPATSEAARVAYVPMYKDWRVWVGLTAAAAGVAILLGMRARSR